MEEKESVKREEGEETWCGGCCECVCVCSFQNIFKHTLDEDESKQHGERAQHKVVDGAQDRDDRRRHGKACKVERGVRGER